MKYVIQRVIKSSVTIDNEVVASIDKGYLVLIGIEGADNKEIADKMLEKMIKLRIFEDDNGKTNLSLADVKGELLLVSQFTLYADCKKGNRPGFTNAANPVYAEELYNYIVEKCKTLVDTKIQTGQFGADMKVELINDGPFTIILDSREIL